MGFPEIPASIQGSFLFTRYINPFSLNGKKCSIEPTRLCHIQTKLKYKILKWIFRWKKLKSWRSPDDGRSEYLVQYTQAGQSKGCDEGELLVCELSESELRHWSPLSSRGFRGASSGMFAFFAPLMEPGFEVPSSARVPSTWPNLKPEEWFSRPLRMPDSRFKVPSFLRPKSGRRILSMKKFVILWGRRLAGACNSGRMALLDSSPESCRSASLLLWSFSSILKYSPSTRALTPFSLSRTQIYKFQFLNIFNFLYCNL